MLNTRERDALVRAIVMQPEDDLPRLVLADWYEENGKLDMASFIRLEGPFQFQQCRYGWSPAITKQLSVALHTLIVARRVLKRLSLPLGCEVLMRYGFVEQVTCYLCEWSGIARTLVKLHPVKRVRVLNCVPAQATSDVNDVARWDRPYGIGLPCTSRLPDTVYDRLPVAAGLPKGCYPSVEAANDALSCVLLQLARAGEPC